MKRLLSILLAGVSLLAGAEGWNVVELVDADMPTPSSPMPQPQKIFRKVTLLKAKGVRIICTIYPNRTVVETVAPETALPAGRIAKLSNEKTTYGETKGTIPK